jgi:cytoskeletal protein RodZ
MGGIEATDTLHPSDDLTTGYLTMNNHNPQERRARGQAMRAARLSRTRMIRRRIIGGSLALFVAAWLWITIVLVSGHDPALAKQSSASTVASTPATTTSSGTDSGTSSGSQTSDSSSNSSSSSSSSSSGNSGSGTVSSVTTSQS